jgi:hypothetical protein
MSLSARVEKRQGSGARGNSRNPSSTADRLVAESCPSSRLGAPSALCPSSAADSAPGHALGRVKISQDAGRLSQVECRFTCDECGSGPRRLSSRPALVGARPAQVLPHQVVNASFVP